MSPSDHVWPFHTGRVGTVQMPVIGLPRGIIFLVLPNPRGGREIITLVLLCSYDSGKRNWLCLAFSAQVGLSVPGARWGGENWLRLTFSARVGLLAAGARWRENWLCLARASCFSKLYLGADFSPSHLIPSCSRHVIALQGKLASFCTLGLGEIGDSCVCRQAGIGVGAVTTGLTHFAIHLSIVTASQLFHCYHTASRIGRQA